MQHRPKEETARALFYAREFIQDQLPESLLALSLQVDTEKKHI